MKQQQPKRRFVRPVLRFALILVLVLTGVLYVNRNKLTRGQTADVLPALPLGSHSARPVVAYQDRGSDPKSDNSPRDQRAQKDDAMKSHRTNWSVSDPGAVVNGRTHDTEITTVESMWPSLPTAMSDAVIVGTLSDSHAFVGPDHGSVYTEHQFKVEQVIKSNDPSIVPGASVISTRRGASVVFPSGHIKDYVWRHQGVPKPGLRYLAFLWHPTNSGAFGYYLLTAYELIGGKAYALDDEKPYTQYEGVDESAILATAQVGAQ